MAKIIIAGGGHGGIACASMLAKNGYDVTVYERNAKDKMGYDWTDIFDSRAILKADMELPPEDKYTIKGDVTFFGPSERTKFVQRSPKNQPQVKMERADIYDMLISHAEKCGVKFEYSHNILSAISKDNRIIGIKTDKGDIFGDLIIDACGCDSPVRKSLPDNLGIQKEMNMYEKFYIYRAFFNKASDEKVEDEFKLTLLPQGVSGIGWVMTEEAYTDVLVGRFDEFSIEEANEAIEHFRKLNKNIGNKILRGGSFATIPVRQPLAKMVADGYVAIGDSAFMTMPLIGSGIANALCASRLLADAIVNDSTQQFNADALWEYQKAYYKKIAPVTAPLACLKNVLAKIKPEQLDNIFDKDIIEFQERIPFENEKAADLISMLSGILIRLRNAISDKAFSKEAASSIKNMAKLLTVIAAIPSQYDENAVLVWAQRYNKIF